MYQTPGANLVEKQRQGILSGRSANRTARLLERFGSVKVTVGRRRHYDGNRGLAGGRLPVAGQGERVRTRTRRLRLIQRRRKGDISACGRCTVELFQKAHSRRSTVRVATLHARAKREYALYIQTEPARDTRC